MAKEELLAKEELVAKPAAGEGKGRDCTAGVEV